MKLKIYSFFILLVFLFGVMIFHVPEKAKAQPTQTHKQIMEKMFLDKGLDKAKEKDRKKMEALAEKIVKLHGKLHKLFEARKVCEIAALYEDHDMVVVSAESKMFKSKDNICKFLKEVVPSDEKIKVSVKITAEKVFLTPIVELKDMGDDTIDCIALIICKVRVIKETGEKAKNETYITTSTEAHRRPCPWG
ncbi:MAG: hypothetical protein GTO17_11925 [Candidatus Aminicenantes bacterium]|nr:hypothetical protein [Candidatus Aminicenantes bacterium]